MRMVHTIGKGSENGNTAPAIVPAIAGAPRHDPERLSVTGNPLQMVLTAGDAFQSQLSQMR